MWRPRVSRSRAEWPAGDPPALPRRFSGSFRAIAARGDVGFVRADPTGAPRGSLGSFCAAGGDDAAGFVRAISGTMAPARMRSGSLGSFCGTPDRARVGFARAIRGERSHVGVTAPVRSYTVPYGDRTDLIMAGTGPAAWCEPAPSSIGVYMNLILYTSL